MPPETLPEPFRTVPTTPPAPTSLHRGRKSKKFRRNLSGCVREGIGSLHVGWNRREFGHDTWILREPRTWYLVYLAWSSREQVGVGRERARYFDFTYEDPPGGLGQFFSFLASHRGPKKMFLSKFPLDRSFKVTKISKSFIMIHWCLKMVVIVI